MLDSLGSDEEWRVAPPEPEVVAGLDMEGSARTGMRAAFWRMAFRLVKYMADPKPVRRADGTAPRQRAGSRCGAARMSAMAALSECEPDCWTRVLRRSMGWRRTAERTPDPRPAPKWKAESWRSAIWASWSSGLGHHTRLRDRLADAIGHGCGELVGPLSGWAISPLGMGPGGDTYLLKPRRQRRERADEICELAITAVF